MGGTARDVIAMGLEESGFGGVVTTNQISLKMRDAKLKALQNGRDQSLTDSVAQLNLQRRIGDHKVAPLLGPRVICFNGVITNIFHNTGRSSPICLMQGYQLLAKFFVEHARQN